MVAKRLVLGIIVMAVALSGGLLFFNGCSPGEFLDISPPPGQQFAGQIYIDGAVAIPSVYRTDTQGTIEFITDGESLWVKMVDRP
ncbi:MAG: hypothetical protein ABUK03_00515 [Dehalococcoidales bacterium]